MSTKMKSCKAESTIVPGRWFLSGGRVARFLITAKIILLLLLHSGAQAGAGNNSHVNHEARYSLSLPERVQTMARERAGEPGLDPAHIRLRKEALEKYDAAFVLPDRLPETDGSLVILGVKTYRHERRFLGIPWDYLAIHEFFDAGMVGTFADAIRARLVQRGAADAVVKDLILDEKNSSIGFTCAYRFPDEDDVEELHKIFLGGSHLVYLDLILYSVEDRAAYHGLFQDVASSLTFRQGFGARESVARGFMGKVASFELGGVKLSSMARSGMQAVFVIFLLNLALEFFSGSGRGRGMRLGIFQENKKLARFLTVPVGFIAYLLII